MDLDKIIRCRGRLGNSTLQLNSKNPILLSASHYFVELLILEVHLNTNHSGTTEVVSILREEYWILKARQSVKRILRKCVTCKRFEGLPYAPVNPPDLYQRNMYLRTLHFAIRDSTLQALCTYRTTQTSQRHTYNYSHVHQPKLFIWS